MITWKKHFLYQIDYQHWANEALFASLDHLDEAALLSPQGLFYDSIHHTLNHMLAFQINWRARLTGEPGRHPLDAVLYTDWRELKNAFRTQLRSFQHWLEACPDVYFETAINYRDTANIGQTDWVRDVISHITTHLTNHRGQIVAAAARLGAPVPDLDFMHYRREMRDHLDHLSSRLSA